MLNSHRIPKVFEAWAWEGLGHDVGNHVLGGDVLDGDHPLLDEFPDEVFSKADTLH